MLGQSAVDGKINEINALAPLLDRIDITDALTPDTATPTTSSAVARITC
jgi:hypothetical protein